MTIFSTRKMMDAISAGPRRFLMTPTHRACSPTPFNFGFVRAVNVTKQVTAHPTNESGISTALRMRAYFLVPEETTPQRNMKIHGMAFDKSFEIHRLSHPISIHVKKRMTFI